MKTVILWILISLITSAAMGHGGVDVGNGRPKNVTTGINLPKFQEEKEMLDFLKGKVPQEGSTSLEEVRSLIKLGGCEERVKFTDIKSMKVYDFSHDKAQARQTGFIYVELQNCHHPEKIKQEEEPKEQFHKVISFQ